MEEMGYERPSPMVFNVVRAADFDKVRSGKLKSRLKASPPTFYNRFLIAGFKQENRL